MWKQLFSVLMYIFKEYFTNAFKTKFLEAVNKGKNEFFKILWDSLREEVCKNARDVIISANKYFLSEGVKVKKEELVDRVLKKVKLPLILRPFKGIIKKNIINKVDDMVTTMLQHAVDTIA